MNKNKFIKAVGILPADLNAIREKVDNYQTQGIDTRKNRFDNFKFIIHNFTSKYVASIIKKNQKVNVYICFTFNQKE